MTYPEVYQRGAFINNTRWKKGPDFLWKTEDHLPQQPFFHVTLDDEDLELKREAKTFSTSAGDNTHDRPDETIFLSLVQVEGTHRMDVTLSFKAFVSTPKAKEEAICYFLYLKTFANRGRRNTMCINRNRRIHSETVFCCRNFVKQVK